MRRTRHPEFVAYLRDQQASERCRRAVAAWQADDRPFVAHAYSLQWTYKGAQAFVAALADLFRAYNRVLWEDFDYCGQCVGGCCVLNATRVQAFDLIALALLGESLPTLAEGIEISPRDCIYRTARGCAWPATWRPVKCWCFYCLGGGHLALSDSPSGQLGALTGALREVVREHLPPPLRSYQAQQSQPLVAHLDDPVRFASALDRALNEVFVAPFSARYPEAQVEAQSTRTASDSATAGPEEAPDAPSPEEEVLAFIARTVGQLSDSPSIELLADLEQLEWIAAGHPADGQRLLNEMYQRYAADPPTEDDAQAALWRQTRDCVAYLRDRWTQFVPGSSRGDVR
jgi:hypothetical protein